MLSRSSKIVKVASVLLVAGLSLLPARALVVPPGRTAG